MRSRVVLSRPLPLGLPSVLPKPAPLGVRASVLHESRRFVQWMLSEIDHRRRRRPERCPARAKGRFSSHAVGTAAWFPSALDLSGPCAGTCVASQLLDDRLRC